MTSSNLELADKGREVVKAVVALREETRDLARLNDSPHVHEEDIETAFSILLRLVSQFLKH